jgi:hypothetical protein
LSRRTTKSGSAAEAGSYLALQAMMSSRTGRRSTALPVGEHVGGDALLGVEELAVGRPALEEQVATRTSRLVEIGSGRSTW